MGHQGGQPVVVTEADLVIGDGVVLVDGGDHPKGQEPAEGLSGPVKAFWSVTMYDAGYFFVDNPLNKYTVSPRNDLKYNADGSLDLFIQNESPGKDKEANWLPAPKGEFVLMLRMYWPETRSPSIIDGSWKIPPVTLMK